MSYYVGVDLGGTNVRACKMDDEGKILEEYVSESYGLIGPKEKIRDAIFSVLDQISDITSTKGIGIAVPGPVDTYNKVMSISNNLVGFKNFPIAAIIEQRYKLPVYIDNDANMAGLAEAMLGSGKGKPIVYYITHSTGIGGALIINHHVLSGQTGYAGEIGNIIVRDVDEDNKGDLNNGSIEALSSGRGLGVIASKLYGEGSTARVLFDNYKKGDPKAIDAINEMADQMGKLLATIGQICDPHIFVIGGGVANHQNSYYFDKMIENYHKYFNGVRPAEIALASLKEPGVMGAAMLVKANGEV